MMSDFGFKIETDFNGNYTLTSADGSLTGGAPEDSSNSVTVSSDDGVYFDWSSSLGIDAVIAKGGPDGNVYVYVPESFGDTGLHSPINPSNGQPYAISHIEFCYDYELSVLKDALGSFDRVYSWSITKDFDATYAKNIGDAATTHGYQVSVVQTITDANYAVTGSIQIDNTTPLDATIESVVDELDDGTVATVNCGVSLPYVLSAGGQLVCSYSALPNDASAILNTATVSTSGNVGGDEATADVSFTFTEVGFSSITVSDTNGQGWSASGSATWTYSKDFVCPTDTSLYVNGSYSFQHDNTATIDQTGQADDATVIVNCYAPIVTKTVGTATLDREYKWEITKGDDATYDDFIGDPANNHTYTITVTKTGEVADSNWLVSGSITVDNPGTLPMPLSSVSDSINGVAATVNCAGGTMVLPGGQIQCSYSASAADGLDGDETLNTATATLNGISFTGTAEFSYDVGNEINAEINVTDSAEGEADQGFGPFGETTSFDYQKDFQCPTDVSLYTNGTYSMTRLNTATIDETDQFDTATVALNCYAPVVTKDAAGSYDERHDWDIEKSVNPDSQSGFIGDTLSWEWTVTLSETSVDENFEVSGSITVANAHPTESMTLSALIDSVDGVSATVDCASLAVPAAGSLICSYIATQADGLGGDESNNIATATFNGLDFSGQAGFDYVKTVINGTADVTDLKIGLETTVNAGEGPWTWTETEEGRCSTDQSLYEGDGEYSFDENNTATVTFGEGESDSADASTTVVCFAPLVRKDADTEWFKKYTWQITKSVDPASHTGFSGDSFTSDYEVFVDQTIDEYGFRAFGSIYVSNPADAPESITVSVADAVNGSNASVDCGDGTASLTVAPGAMGSCDYTVDLDDNTSLTNTATVSFNGSDFSASADVIFGDPIIEGDPTINVTDYFDGGAGEPLGEASDDFTFEYSRDFVCSSIEGDYTGGEYSKAFPNYAEIDETGQQDDAKVDLTCRIPALAKVIKTTTEGDEDIGQFPFQFGLFEPGADTSDLGNAIEEGTLNGAGEVNFTTELEEEGTWTVVEFLPDGWISETALECTFDVAYPAAANRVFECSFDNTEASRVDLVKLTNGLYDPSKTWTFTIYEGPDGFGGTEVASDSTPTDLADAGLLRFGDVNLDPGATYTICEIEVPAGYSTVWAIDNNNDGIIDNGDTLVTPYNPNADDNPSEDVGHRCVDFGAGTTMPSIPLVPGETLHFIVDNQFPGGAPRTPGYWKNWNTCTNGGQADTAAANGGWEEGYWLLEDVLDPAIGGGIIWDDILDDDFEFPITGCAEPVLILDKRDLSGKKQASDPLHNLATHLLAAQLNFGAGACTTQDALQWALEAEELLDKYNFDGYGHDNLKKNDPDAQLANELATDLDDYNNGMYCGDSDE